MKKYYSLLIITAALILLASCKKNLVVNADWKDVTVVYGLLDQTESVHYVKVTKAFLGEGDALVFAKQPDSSEYAHRLQVTMDELNGSTLLRTITLHYDTISNKDTGVFYCPTQHVYSTTATLSPDLTYHLVIKDTVTNKVVEGTATLVSDFDIDKPSLFTRATFQSGKSSEVKWTSAKSGKRYQVNIRIRYAEATIGVPNSTVIKSLDWLALTDMSSLNVNGGQTMDYFINGDAFYIFMGSHIPVDPTVTRALRDCDYIFTVGSEDLSTYMDVTAPSNTIIQERPAFTDIINGIGLFTARVVKSVDTLRFSTFTLDEIKTNQYTKDLGF
ncbi:MAG: hypothetical protein NTU51_03725 [Bacteroidetes bacterium]|nr:hypothetical protein [Bacteroidota bacterium]